MRHVGLHLLADCALIALAVSMSCYGISDDGSAPNQMTPIPPASAPVNTAPSDSKKKAPSLLIFDSLGAITKLFSDAETNTQNTSATATIAAQKAPNTTNATPGNTKSPVLMTVPDTIISDMRPNSSTVSLKCPRAHLISVINASGKCGTMEIDLKTKVWEKCSRKNACEFDKSIIGKCSDKVVIDTIQYVCSKVQAMDCFLFTSKEKEDERFCLHMCMHFIKSCQSATIPVTREERLRCLYNLYLSHDMSQKCGYIMEDVDSDNIVFNKEEYFNPKYEIGQAVLTNDKWVQVQFKKKIENPVVVTSVLPEDDEYVVLLLDDVTTAGFRISITAVNCRDTCMTSKKHRELSVEWLAISSGDHSPDLDKCIKVGVLEVPADDTVILPLDPRKSWVVLTQVQKVRLDKDSLNIDESQVLVLPVVLRGIWDFTVRFFLPATAMIPKTSVTLGFVAFEDKEEMNLYDIGLKILTGIADDKKHTSVKVKLPYTWPYPSSVFGSTLTFSEHFTGELSSHVSSLYMPQQSKKESNIEAGHYHFTCDLAINYIKAAAIQWPPVVNVVVIEDIASALKRQVCIFAKKKGKRNINNACYEECVGTNGIAKCAGAADLIECYTDRSRSCSLDPNDLKHLAAQYVNYMDEHPANDDIPDGKDALDSSGDDEGIAASTTLPDPNNQSGTGTAIDATNQVSPAQGDINGGYEAIEDVVIRRDCIEGPWGPWSECSNKCTSEKIRSIQVRKRYVYAPKSGSGSRECITSESRPCANIPECSTFCFSRKGNGDKNSFQQQYYYIWSDNCTTNVVDMMDFSYQLWSPHNSGTVPSASVVGTGGVSHSALLKGRDSIAAAVEYSPECTDPNNWTSCNAPCAQTSGEAPVEYLRAPITCPDSKRPCTEPLPPCIEKQSDNVPAVYGACILKHASYDIIDGSWSKDGACICDGGVPCTAEELYMGPDYSDTLLLDTHSALEHQIRGVPFQTLISLAKQKRLELPWGPVKDVTYGTFKDREMNNYCATGTLYLEAFTEDILWVDCKLAVPKKYEPNMQSCEIRCKSLRHHCEREVLHQGIDELVKCLDDTLKYAIDNVYVIGFHHFKCVLVNLGPSIHEEAQICESASTVRGNIKRCFDTCQRVLNRCKMISRHKREEKIRRCMLSHAEKNDIRDKRSKPIGFKERCKFKRSKMYGSGMVYCKTKQIICNLGNWSNWSDCSGVCINLDPENRVVPTRTRRRLLHASDPVSHANCLSKGIRFVESAECLWLPQCPDDKSITADLENTKRKVAWAVELETKWDLQSWVFEESYNEDGEEHKYCSIYSGHRDVSNNKIIYQKSRCSCPPLMTPCSISESVNSPGWFNMVDLLCRQNNMRSVLFNQSSGFYRYSCSTKTFIREDFDAHKELCNEVDGTSFVSCSGASFYTHLYIFGTLAAIIGSLTGILIFVYTYNRSSFV